MVDADPLARALGVRRGIPLGSAHRLAPEATFLDLAPEADRDAVEAACERLAAFSPGIAGTSDVTDPAFGRLAVHVDGLTRLWGIEETLVARIGDALAPLLPGPPRAGIAGTSFAASVAAAHASEGGPPILVPPGDDGRFLAPYPARLLTRDADIRARLARFGLRTIGSVAELPRSAAGGAVRGRGGEAARPGPGRGDGALPATPHRRAVRARPAARSAGRGARRRPVRPPPAGGDARRPAPGAGPGRRARAARRHPRPRLRPARDPADPRPRAAPPGAHGRRRGHRAPAVRPPREGAAAGRRRAPRARARAGRGGDRAAAAPVHAAGRARRPPRLAARAARDRVRDRPRPPGRDHGPGGLDRRGALALDAPWRGRRSTGESSP